jgi:hypothetical protein
VLELQWYAHSDPYIAGHSLSFQQHCMTNHETHDVGDSNAQHKSIHISLTICPGPAAADAAAAPAPAWHLQQLLPHACTAWT